MGFIHKRALLPFEKCGENFNTIPVSFLERFLVLTLLEKKRSAVFEASSYFAFSLT